MTNTIGRRETQILIGPGRASWVFYLIKAMCPDCNATAQRGGNA
jgi:hypothetical protein